MIKDKELGPVATNFTPITCLSLIWKLLTGVISESKRLLPSEQKGCITPCAVWDHFERGKDNYPICRHCGKGVKNKGGNALNLMAHLKTRHFMVYNSLQKKRQHSPSPVRNGVSSTTTNDIQVHEDANETNHEDGEYSQSRKELQPTIVAALEKQTPF